MLTIDLLFVASILWIHPIQPQRLIAGSALTIS